MVCGLWSAFSVYVWWPQGRSAARFCHPRQAAGSTSHPFFRSRVRPTPHCTPFADVPLTSTSPSARTPAKALPRQFKYQRANNATDEGEIELAVTINHFAFLASPTLWAEIP